VIGVRPLLDSDFRDVVALDRRVGGSLREPYFAARLRAALQRPRRHLQLAACERGQMVGFLLARKAGGEYGSPEDCVVVEAIGVDPECRRRGAGSALLAHLAALALARDIHILTTRSDWRRHDMLLFLDKGGFDIAARQLLLRPVGRMPLPESDEELDALPPLVRRMRKEDLTPLSLIDARITGRDRRGYLQGKVDEAVNESAIEVSLVAEDDGFPVGFAIARVDHGDFGHVGALASLDTVAVDPRFARNGFASALLEQMIENLAALHVERLETEVAPGAFDLLRFLHRMGFAPSSQLCFERRL
jgi:ribosomal protein S18 acetylase RimI-like enzyme